MTVFAIPQVAHESLVMNDVREILTLIAAGNLDLEQARELASKGSKSLKSYHPVIQDWVCCLPLRYQGTLLTGIRSCDTAPKIPGLETNDRQLVAYLRYLVLNAADGREVDVPGAFMRSAPPENWKPSEFGHYPQHFVAHLMHAFEVISVKHPKPFHQRNGRAIYLKFADGLHLAAESPGCMYARLTEDRIASGKVVS